MKEFIENYITIIYFSGMVVSLISTYRLFKAKSTKPLNSIDWLYIVMFSGYSWVTVLGIVYSLIDEKIKR